MYPELMVSLELFFIEKLIQRRLVRKLRVIHAISFDELWLVAGHR
jgi:hypothetical protein